MVNIVMGTMKVVPSCAGGGGCPVNLEIIGFKIIRIKFRGAKRSQSYSNDVV